MTDEILNAAAEITHRTALRPAIVYCNAELAYQLSAESIDRPFGPHQYRMPSITEPQAPAGMRTVIDRYLPRGVWRLADEHGTLLYDCRQGRPLAAHATD